MTEEHACTAQECLPAYKAAPLRCRWTIQLVSECPCPDHNNTEESS